MKVTPPITIGTSATFTRASVGTFIGSNGLVQSAAVNVLRFNYDLANLSNPPKVLNEAAATNLILQSEAFDNAAWTKRGTCAITANAIAAPDGNITADLIGGIDVAVTGDVFQSTTIASGTRCEPSLWVKQSTTTGVLALANPAGAGYGQWNVDLSLLGATWTRLTRAHAAVTVVNEFSGSTGNQGGLQVYKVSGSGALSIYAWGAQQEVGTASTSYISTGAATVTRAADTITGQGLIYSSVPEPDGAYGESGIWVSGNTYNAGTVWIYNHRRYKRGVTGAGAITPDLDTANWSDDGPSNRTASLDLLRNTASQAAGSQTYVIAPGQRISSLGIVGAQCASVTISMDIGATNLLYRTYSMVRRNTTGWMSFLTGAFRYRPSLVVYDLPLNTGALITITVTGAPTKLGGMVLGLAKDIGKAQFNASRSAVNFSPITRDAFGNATLVPRRSVPKTDLKLLIEKAYVNVILELMTDLNAVPALWSGLDDHSTDDYFEALLFLGIYKDWSISLDHPTHAVVSLQLEEI